jgi:hypothetical protein
MNMIVWFMNHKEMLHHLPPDKLQQLHEVVKSELARMRSGAMPPSAVNDLVACVDDKLMADIVADSRRTNTPGFLQPDESVVKYGSKGGWQEAIPLSSSVPGTKIIDEIAESFAAIDRRERERQVKG